MTTASVAGHALWLFRVGSAMQKKIPCVIMRGGTSRGPYLKADDLPLDKGLRDQVLLALMGSPHPMQVDGIGGSQAQTSKVAIVSRSQRADCDVDYLFAQVSVDKALVDTRPNCGNMLSGVGPFAIEEGMVAAQAGQTLVRIFNVNTGARIDAIVQTPDGVVTYDGDTAIDGVAGTAAPIPLTFRDFAGARTGKLLPTGQASEVIGGVTVTLIDSAMPMMLLDARDLGVETLDGIAERVADTALMQRIESMRLEAGRRMGMGDVSQSVIPKVGLLLPWHSADLAVGYLMPWTLHRSIAVTGAIAIATASVLPGSVAARLVSRIGSEFSFAHPGGVMTLGVERGGAALVGATVMRTARRLFEGRALVPAELYET
jgi:2-methylaconitate cis-trans-isomerase PrpF